MKKTCQICNEGYSNRSVPIKSLKPEQATEEWNLVELCHTHRIMWIYGGPRSFCLAFPKMKRILQEKGWILTKSGMSHPKQKSNPPL